MTMVESAQWVDAENTMIRTVVDGQELFVPNSPGNRHRRMIAEWEAEGNTIAPAPEEE